MKKRVLSLVLTLCMLLGLLPTAALAAPAAEASTEIVETPQAAPGEDGIAEPLAAGLSFTITPGGAGTCRSYLGGNISDAIGGDSGHAWTRSDWGNYNVSVSGTTLTLKEKAKYKNASYILMPFTITTRVPARTRYSVTLIPTLYMNPNASKGYPHYFAELVTDENNVAMDWKYSTARSSRQIRDWTQWYLFRVGSDYSKFDQELNDQQLNFTNPDDSPKDVSVRLVMEVGVSAAGSSQSDYFHQLECRLGLQYKSHSEQPVVAIVNGAGCTTEDIQGAYNAGSGATCTFVGVSRDGYDFYIKKPGTIDLNGNDLCTGFWILEQGDPSTVVTLQGGGATLDGKGIRQPIHHDGDGTVKVSNITITSANEDPDTPTVHNYRGTMELDSDVTVNGFLFGNKKLKFNGGGPVVTERLGICTPITLNAALASGRNYPLDLSRMKAQADGSYIISDTNPGGNNASHFTVINPSGLIVVDDGARVIARPAQVTFDPAGGTVSPTTAGVTAEGTAAAWPTPTRTGYRFDGWYNGDAKAESTAAFAGDTTLTAHWTAATVNVKFDGNGGTCATVGKDYYVGNKYVDLPAATRTGYTFTGWYTAPSGGTAVTGDTAVTNTNPHTLYAQWTRDQVTVTFDAQGGAVTPGSKTVYHGDRLGTLPAATRTGYTFDGWYTAADGGTKLDGSQSVTANATYYAHWTAVKVQLNYNANGGVLAGGATDRVTYGMAYGDLPGVGGVGGAPTRTGYTFDGWATTAAGGTAVTKETVCDTVSPITIYAQWSANGPYTVSFDLNGGAGTAPGNASLKYDDVYPLPDDPSRTGYTFAGWWTAPSGGTEVTAATKVTNQNAHTLYAHWTATTAQVQYMMNNSNTGAGDVHATTTCTYDQPYVLPADKPTRSSYTFLGWFTAKSGGTEVKAGDLFRETADQTLYAHWRRDEVNVTLNVGGGNELENKWTLVKYGQTYGEAWGGSLPVPTHPNDGTTTYTFTGWYSGTTLVTSTTVMNREDDHTLTAHWNTTHAHAVGGDDVSFTAVPGNVLGTSIEASGNYYLTGNVNVSTVTTVKSGVTLTLCLNGKTLTYTGGHQAFKVEGGGKLYICDCAGTGAVTATGDGVEVNSSFNSTDNTGARGVFTMEGGAITATGIGVRCYGGQFTMNGGSVTSTGGGTDKYGVALSAAANSSSIVTLNGGSVTARGDGSCGVSTYSNENNKLTVNGATVRGEGHGVHVGKGTANILSGTVTGAATGIAASDGTTVNISGGTITSTGTGGKGVNTSAATVTIGGSASITGPTGVSAQAGNVTISGGTITGTTNGISVSGSGTANISGGTVTSNTRGIEVVMGTATVTGGTVTSYTRGIEVVQGTATVTGGTVTGGTAIESDSATNTITITGGTITGKTHNGVKLRGTANISGGTITGKEGCIYLTSGTATIEGDAQITSTTYAGVYMESGTVNLNGGTITSASAGIHAAAGCTVNMTGGSITSTNGSGITVAAGTLTMTGGTVTGGQIGVHSSGTTTIGGNAVVNGGTLRALHVQSGVTTIAEGSAAQITGLQGCYVLPGAELDMKGGSITGSSGYAIYNEGTANISGGTVTGNTSGILAKNTSGTNTVTVSGGSIQGIVQHGIFADGSTVTIEGGTLTGKQCGIYGTNAPMLNVESGTVTATGTGCPGIYNGGGTATITGGTITSGPEASGIDNEGALTVTGGTVNGSYFALYAGASSSTNNTTLGGKPTLQSTAGDIGLTEGRIITLSTDTALEADAKYSVALYNHAPAEGAPIAITGTNTADESDHFTAFEATQGVQNSDGNVVQLYIPHKHPICGAVCTHTPAHEPVEFKPLVIGEDGAVENGNYYLPEDMGQTFDIATGRGVNLCLNGHTLTTGQYANCLHYNAVLNLSDCSEGQTGGFKNTGSTFAISVGGAFNQYSGILSTVQPQPVKLDPTTSSAWNFYGGKMVCSDGATTPVIEPTGQIALQGDAGAVQFSFTENAKPVHIGAAPAAPYKVTTNVYPVTVADGLPQDAVVGDYFTCADKLVLEAAEGKATLRCRRFTVDGGTYTAEADGTCSAADAEALNAAKKLGFTLDGYYTQATGGEAFAISDSAEIGDNAALYAHWTACTAHEKPAEGVTTVPSTCTVQGSERFTCAKCGLSVTNALPLAAHQYDAENWTFDDASHWHACTVCGTKQEDTEAAHTWGAAVTTPGETEDTDAYTCSVCAAARTETVPKYTYTLLTDAWSTPAGQAAQGTAREGASVTLPTDVTRTGYTLSGWVPEGDAGETPLTGNYTMPAQDVTLRAKWTLTPDYQPESGQPVVLAGGATVTKNDDGTVTIQQPGGGETTVTAPDGNVTITEDADGNETVNVPVGSTVQTDGGPTVTVGPDGGAVNAGGGVDAGAGSTVTIPNGDGTSTTVEITGGDGHIDPDGGVTFPPADPDDPGATSGTVTVDQGDGSGPQALTVSGDSGGVDPTTGTVAENGPDDQVILPDGTVVTLPDPTDPDKGGITDNGDGSTVVPGGSQVELPDGSTVTLDDTPGTVTETGDVTIPAGGTATVTDDKGHQTTVKVPEGGETGTVSNNGDIQLPEGGTVTVEDGQGGHTVITAPTGGGTVIKDPDGNLTAPAGSTVTTYPGDGGEPTTETVPEGGQTVTPGSNHGVTTELAPGESKTIPHEGTITNNGDGTVTITDLHGTETTVTLPEGTTNIEVDTKTGEVTLPGGSTVQTGETGPEITVPGGGTVKPDGTVTVPQGGTVTITDGSDTTTITPPDGGEVTPSEDGGVHVDKGATVQTGDGPVITLPETGDGGTVHPGGTVTGSPVQVGDATIDVTATDPTQGDITTDKDGNVTLPGGTTANVDKDGDGQSDATVTVPDGTGDPGDSATVKPSGDIDLPAGGSVTVPGGAGKPDTTVTMPEDKGGTVGTDESGNTTVPGGATVQTGTGAPITVGDDTTGTVDPATGEVTVPGGGSVTIPDGNGGTTQVTVPEGGTPGTVKPATDGGVEAPGGSTVTHTPADGEPTTSEVPAGGGTVKPDGTVTEGGDTPTPPTPEHTHDYGDWSHDETGHWHECTAADCPDPDKGRKDEADHAYTDDADTTCDVCGYERTLTPPQPDVFTVTFDAQGGEPAPENQTVEAGKRIAKPAAPTKEGFTFRGWFTQATGGTAWQFNTDAVTEDLTLYAQWEEDTPGTTVTPENPVELPDGTKVEQDPDTGDVTITTGGEGGSTTTVTPGEGDVTVDTDTGEVTVPAGSQVTVPGGTAVELPDGGKVDGDGSITLPDGGSATIPGGEGGTGTTVTVPDGGGTLTTDPESGAVTVPGGSTVKPGETGPEVTVPDGSTVDPATGGVTVPGGSTVTIPDGQGGHTEITVPAEGDQTVTPTGDGVQVPQDSTVTTEDGTTLTVTEGAGTVAPDGTVTLPEGGKVTVTKDGETTTVTVAPGGSVGPDYTEPEPPTPSRPGITRPSGYTPSVQQPDHGQVTVSPTRPAAGSQVTVTVTPDEGYEVDTVTVTDRNGKPVEVTRNADGTFTFTQPTGAVSIVATMKEAACPRDETCPIWPYTDASATAWYHDGVHFCVERGLMIGTSNTTFEPETDATRAMLATILWRLRGSPVVNYALRYDDVANGTWYTEAVRWATSEGIVEGYGNGNFGPEDSITREQLATMLYRYEQKYGKGGFTGMWMFLLDFQDADRVSEWANEAIHWMTMNQIITGKDDKVLDPTGTATRAEAATMLMRYIQAAQ